MPKDQTIHQQYSEEALMTLKFLSIACAMDLPALKAYLGIDRGNGENLEKLTW